MSKEIEPFTEEQIAKAIKKAKADGRFFTRNVPESKDAYSAIDHNIDVFKRLNDR